jgi:hypothetical protein
VILSASANNEVTRGKIPVDWCHLDLALLSQETSQEGEENGEEEDKFERGFTAYTDDEFAVVTQSYYTDVRALSDVKFWTAQVCPLFPAFLLYRISTSLSLSLSSSLLPFFLLSPILSSLVLSLYLCPASFAPTPRTLLQVPLEVTKVLTAQGDSLDMKLRNYMGTRAREWSDEHRRYLRGIDAASPELKVFHRALSAARYGVKAIDSTCYDKRLMFLGADDLFHILTPLARRVIYSMAEEDQRVQVDLFVAEQILSDETGRYTADVKGRVLERYVIDTVARNHLWKATATKKQQRSRSLIKLDMKVELKYEKIDFNGNGVPSQRLDWEESLLFDPEQTNYPAVDLFVWDAIKKVLYAIQVTIQSPLGAHMKDTLDQREAKEEEGKGKNGTKGGEKCERLSKWKEIRDKWDEILPKGSKIELVWLADNDKCCEDRKLNEWIVLIDTLHNEFPLVSKLKH